MGYSPPLRLRLADGEAPVRTQHSSCGNRRTFRSRAHGAGCLVRWRSGELLDGGKFDGPNSGLLRGDRQKADSVYGCQTPAFLGRVACVLS